MNVLVLNCSSSSLKLRVGDICDETSNTMISGMVDHVGGQATLQLEHGAMSDTELKQKVLDHDQAGRCAFEYVIGPNLTPSVTVSFAAVTGSMNRPESTKRR